MLTPQMIDWMRHSALLSQMSVDDHTLTHIEREQHAWLAQKKQEILRKMMRGEALDEHETIVADYLLVYAREHVNDTVRSGRIGEARREMMIERARKRSQERLNELDELLEKESA